MRPLTAPLHPITEENELPNYPLIFTFRDVITGNGYLAGVTVTGNALMVFEDEKWWAYGVRPAGLAECGTTPQEAYARFMQRLKLVLFDIAEETDSFMTFRQAVEDFYYEPDAEEETRWNDAFLALREGRVVPEAPFSELPRNAPETRPTQISVERLDKPQTRFKPTDNVPCQFSLAAAA